MERLRINDAFAAVAPPPPPFKLPSVSDIQAERMKRQFSLFVRAAWHVIEPATPLIWNWHLDAICDHVQALVEGTLGKQNLIINVPPGSMKSTIVSICLIPWIWLKKPHYRGAFASGVPGIESRDSGKCRIILESEWYRQTFGIDWRFSRDQNEKLYYRNTKTGERLATTTGAGVTGHRFNGLYVDDALDARKAFQDVEVNKVNLWWDQAWWNRIADEKTSTRCVIGQRLREDDLPGHVLERDGLETWEWLMIPQLWGESEEGSRRVTSLGWTDPREYYVVPTDQRTSDYIVPPEVLMFEERFPREAISRDRLVLGQSGFEGQHQQRPSMLQGEIFQKGHAQFIPRNMIPQGVIIQRMLSIDSAIKEKEENDFSVILEGWEFDRGVFISGCINEKWRYTQLKEQVTLEALKVNPHALLIEDKASGQNLIQEYQNAGTFPVIPIMPLIDKLARARPLTPYWEANRVFFPCDENGVPEPWVATFLSQLYKFPKDKHDDMVDAFTQMLQFLFLSPGARGLLDYYGISQAIDAKLKAAREAEDAVHHPVHKHYINGAIPQ